MKTYNDAFLCIIALVSVIPVHSVKSNLYVSSIKGSDTGTGTPTSPFLTLHHALQKSSDFGDINVFPGVYTGSLNFPDLSYPGTPKNITIKGYNSGHTVDPHNHEINARGQSTTFRMGGGSILEGLTFAGVRGQTVATFGIVWSPFNAQIRNCIFQDNTKAIGVTGRGTTFLENVTFDLGGGTNGIGIAFVYSSGPATVKAEGLTFTGDARGTAVDLNLGNFYVTDVEVKNISTFITGGDATYGDFDASVTGATIVGTRMAFYSYGFPAGKYKGRVVLSGITADGAGCAGCDGPAVHAGPLVTVALVDSKVSNCNTTGIDSYKRGGQGGALFCDKTATINIQNTTFTNNIAIDGAVGYCEDSCAFLATGVKQSSNTATKDTHPCKGL
jgi:hypothetical protein